MLNPDGSFAYTPNADFHGTDNFTYQATDGMVASSPVTVTITVASVNDSPTTSSDAYEANENEPLTVDA
jgi:VCBS repeat-containing protein